MYHTIVKRIARKNFERVNQREFDALLADCVPNVRHRFGGNHAIGGERPDREALPRWFNRLKTSRIVSATAQAQKAPSRAAVPRGRTRTARASASRSKPNPSTAGS